MCGLYGFFKEGKTDYPIGKVKNALKDLALANMSRGKDSTGIVAINNANDVISIRKTIPSKQFINRKRVKEYIRETISHNTNVVIGHTRMATCGAVTVRNAMPFEVRNIVGAHNGHISNHWSLKTRYRFKHKTQVDSEIIFRLMAKYDDLLGRANALGELNGYFATVFYDLNNPNKLFIGRDYQTFSLVREKRYGFFMWSSEAEPLAKVAKKYKFKFDKVKIEDYSLVRLGKDVEEVEDIYPVVEVYNDYKDSKKRKLFSWDDYPYDSTFIEDEYILDNDNALRSRYYGAEYGRSKS